MSKHKRLRPTPARAEAIHRGMHYQLIGFRGVLCPDGVRRYASVTGHTRGYDYVPASVSAHGRTVSGFISTIAGSDGDQQFIPFLPGKNAGVFYEWLDGPDKLFVDLIAEGKSAADARELVEQAFPRAYR